MAYLIVVWGCDSGTSGPRRVPILGTCNVRPNYVAEVGLNRWREFPLRFALVDSTFPAEDRDLLLPAILEGIHQWAASTDGRIGALIAISDATEADLVIRADDLGPDIGARAIHGTATPFLGDAQIIFNLEELDFYLMNPDLLTELASHEIGHVLGIIGHPSMGGLLMSSPIQAERPTTPDLNTMMHAYCRP